jgi:hypothetical protein
LFMHTFRPSRKGNVECGGERRTAGTSGVCFFKVMNARGKLRTRENPKGNLCEKAEGKLLPSSASQTLILFVDSSPNMMR